MENNKQIRFWPVITLSAEKIQIFQIHMFELA